MGHEEPKTAGIAVWGLGPHALKNVLPAIESSPVLALAGVCTRNAASASVGSIGHDITVWTDPESMLASDTVQIVYLATPTGLHFRQAAQVLRAGKHIICEKSLTSNLSHSEQLVELAREHDLVLCEALMYLYHARFQLIEETIRSPSFGRALHAFACFSLPPLANPGFRTDAALGGGAFLDVGCYPLSLMGALFESEPQVLHAAIGSSSGQIDTSGTARLRFGTAFADVMWSYDASYAADLIVIGELGSVQARRVFAKDTGADSSFIVRDRFGTPTAVQIPEGNGFVSMFAGVVDALANPLSRARLRDRAAAQARLMDSVFQAAS